MFDIDTISKFLLLIVTGTFPLLLFRQYVWQNETESMIRKLCHITSIKDKNNFHDHHNQTIKDALDYLPLVIQRYLKQVLLLIDDEDRGTSYMIHEPIQVIKNVRINQDGEILINNNWLPFQAFQVASCIPSSPGFIWDSRITLFSGIPILNRIKVRARDYFIEGEGNLKVNLAGAIPMANLTGKEANVAEFMRWIAEMAFYPTAFLPHDGARLRWVKDVRAMKGPWSEYHGSFARGKLSDPSSDIEGEIEFHFDENNLLKSIRGYRLMTNKGKNEYLPWEGHISDYTLAQGIMVPTSVTAGYYIDDEFIPYFKGKCNKFHFDFF